MALVVVVVAVVLADFACIRCVLCSYDIKSCRFFQLFSFVVPSPLAAPPRHGTARLAARTVCRVYLVDTLFYCPNCGCCCPYCRFCCCCCHCYLACCHLLCSRRDECVRAYARSSLHSANVCIINMYVCNICIYVYMYECRHISSLKMCTQSNCRSPVRQSGSQSLT